MDKSEQARDLIKQALETYLSNESVMLPAWKKEVGSNEYHTKLTPENIRHGVVLFLLVNKLMSGSAQGPEEGAEVDLYNLLNNYLLDIDKRKSINTFLKQ